MVLLRPPLAQVALDLTAERRVLLRLRRPWRDDTRAIRCEPSDLLEKLAALVPRPRVNLLVKTAPLPSAAVAGLHGLFFAGRTRVTGERQASRRARGG